METLLNTEQVATLLQVSPRTLAGWRIRGRGPRFVRFSHRAVRYQPAAIAAWLRQYRTTPVPGTRWQIAPRMTNPKES